MYKIDFRTARNLNSANFANANISGANFSGQNLQAAKMQGVRIQLTFPLYDTLFQCADLRKASFAGSNLFRVNFECSERDKKTLLT